MLSFLFIAPIQRGVEYGESQTMKDPFRGLKVKSLAQNDQMNNLLPQPQVQGLPPFRTVATADTAATAGIGVVTQAGVQGVPWIAFKTGGGQVAEVVGRQQGVVVALRTAHPFAHHMSPVLAGGGAVVLARTGGVAVLAVAGDIDRTVEPVEGGLTAVAARRAAGLIDRIIAGRTALGVVGGSKEDAGHTFSVKMERRFSAGSLMTNTAIAVYAGQGIVNRVGAVAVGVLITGRGLSVRRPVVAGGAVGLG